jgi:hypothetical protein
MVLDAKVGVNRREGRGGSRSRGGSVRSHEAPSEERAAFRINVKDLRFLKSVGIDPTRKVRNRRGTLRTRLTRPARRVKSLKSD